MSIEVGEGVVEKLTQWSFREQAERKFSAGEDAVGIELPVDFLQIAFECLTGSNGVPVEFPVDVAEFVVTDLTTPDGAVGIVEPVGLLLGDQRRFSFSQFHGLTVGQEILGVVDHPATA